MNQENRKFTPLRLFFLNLISDNGDVVMDKKELGDWPEKDDEIDKIFTEPEDREKVREINREEEKLRRQEELENRRKKAKSQVNIIKGKEKNRKSKIIEQEDKEIGE